MTLERIQELKRLCVEANKYPGGEVQVVYGAGPVRACTATCTTGEMLEFIEATQAGEGE